MNNSIEYFDVGKRPEGYPWLYLRELHLIGLDANKILKPDSLMLNLECITALNLESCPELDTALDTLATERNKSDVPLRACLRLQSFSLRHENSTQHFRAGLIDFLGAIQGLTHLSVLLENGDRSGPNDLDPMLAVHGPTLRSLVWDERSGKRDSWIPLEPNAEPSHRRLKTIAKHCPHLVELGISMNWEDFMTQGTFSPDRCNRRMTTAAFSPLKKLRTLNIRNMPLVKTQNMALPLAEIHAAFAESLLTILGCNRDDTRTSAPQNLKTLALGALTYRDVYNGIGYHTIHNRELYEFLRLKVYRIVSSRDAEGRQRPLAKLTESGTYEKTEANGGDVDVLKPYWLG
ncbi:MAG: hypothetical protein Q9169_006218 [Polycauliona sp. 2 TL-2023]